MKRLAAAFITTLLVTGTMAGNVFAANTTVDSLEVGKTLTITDGTIAPSETFSFSMAPKEVTEDKEIDGLKVKSGVAFDEGSAETAFTTTDTVSDGKVEKKTSFDISNIQFEKDAPAIYRYEVTENAGTSNGMTYDDTSYVVDLYVNNDGKVTATVAHVEGEDGNETGDKVPVEFTNDYATENLEVKKVVAGTFGEKNKDFTFTLLVEGCDTLPANTVLTATKTAQDTTSQVQVTVGTETTFTLKDGETLALNNLPEGISYEVTEAEAEGYTATYEVNGQTVDAGKSEIVDGDNAVVITNTKGDIATTGINMNVIPYVVAVVIAIAGIAAFAVRRKRNMNV